MNAPANILVFRIGQLGDTMVAVPSFRALRRHFPNSRMTLLCDRQIRKRYVLAPELLEGAGLFDDFLVYVHDPSRWGRWIRPAAMARLLVRLRARRFDTLVYLAPSTRLPEAVSRDRRFFARAGMERLLGFEGFRPLPRKIPGQPLGSVPPEADLLLERLAASGVPVPPAGGGEMDLGLSDREERQVAAWLAVLRDDGGRPWVGVGPGSKMPAKVWPEERFRDVVETLIQENDVWPVVFGGAEDREKGERLLASWGRGHNAAGALGLRSAAAALRRCRLYLGNDTGPMHLAAGVGTPCIAVFSSREYPGAWSPYGAGHRVFRTAIDCDGCMLVTCIERGMECILSISVDAVLQACREILAKRLQGP